MVPASSLAQWMLVGSTFSASATLRVRPVAQAGRANFPRQWAAPRGAPRPFPTLVCIVNSMPTNPMRHIGERFEKCKFHPGHTEIDVASVARPSFGSRSPIGLGQCGECQLSEEAVASLV